MWVLESFNKLNNIENIEYYSKGVIHKMWHSMSGTPGYSKIGQHMRFANYADRAIDVGDLFLTTDDEKQVEIADIMQELNKLLVDPKQQNKAKLFNEFILGKNRLTISKETGINYRIVHDAVKQTAQNIKSNMTKNEIKARLLSEGISANYSGKEKTFYTNKKPSVELEKAIIRAGFKTQSK